MKKVNFSLALLLCAFMIFAVGCDSGGSSDNPSNEEPVTAIEDNFDTSAGSIYISKPDSEVMNGAGSGTYADNATIVSDIDGHTCVAIHDNAVDNNSYGFAVEAQWDLSGSVNMSSGSYTVSFDIFVPAAIFDKGAHVQVSLLDDDFNGAYSTWFTGSIAADTWSHLDVDVIEGDDNFNYWTLEPTALVVTKVRVQVIIDGSEANGDPVAEGSEVLFYVDNLAVKNF